MLSEGTEVNSIKFSLIEAKFGDNPLLSLKANTILTR